MMKLQKFLKTLLVILLVIGLLGSSFGVAVAALTDQALRAKDEKEDPSSQSGEETPAGYVSPLEQYGGSRDGEAKLNDNVQIVSDEDTQILEKTFVSAESVNSWGRQCTRYTFTSTALIPDQDQNTEQEGEETLTPEEEQAKQEAIAQSRQTLSEVVNRVGEKSMIYLPASEKSVFGGPRVFTIIDYWASEYSETVYLDLKEPSFEEAFQSVDICATEMLKEENLVNASFAPGVSAYFGDASNPISATPTANTDTQSQVVLLGEGNKYSTENGDLVVNLDYKLKGDEVNGIETELKLTGSFGIRDLQAHIVSRGKLPNMEELYCGLSGQVFANIGFEGSVKGEAKPEATKLDVLGLFSIEGLEEKRFPIAVFEFKGTTPVYLTNQAFENSPKALPSLFVLLYADWQGNIGITLNTSLNYTESFNSGLRIFRNGEFDVGFEEYPYPTDLEETEEDGLSWETKLTVEAETDLTLFGGSVVFYVAGVNLAEIGVAKVGVEAKCNLTVEGGLNQRLQVTGDTDANAYIRGYLKLLEVKAKIKFEGETLFENYSKEASLDFCLMDLTLFVWGKAPDEYKKKTPVSTMERPDEFAAAFCIVCDVSGSMGYTVSSGQTKLQAAQDAAVAVTRSVETWSGHNDGNYGVGVAYFSDDGSNLVLPHIDYTYIEDSIALLNQGGGTNIYAGIQVGTAQLEALDATNKVIILMTDGQDTYGNPIMDAAQAAKEAGIVIYTIGFGEDADETVLTQVAEATGGEYRYANTENITSIMGKFITTQQDASGADILDENEGTVAEGEKSKKTNFTVKDKSGKLMVTTVWPGSFLDTILVDPNGRVVDENYPDAVTDESRIPSTIVVNNPIPGKWSLRVLGVETSYEQEPFYTVVAFKETKPTPVNRTMDTMQEIAAWCLPLGVVITLTSAMLLVGLGKTKKKEN